VDFLLIRKGRCLFLLLRITSPDHWHVCDVKTYWR